MPFDMRLWQVTRGNLSKVRKVRLDSERRLEDWIEQKPILLGDRYLFLGRQVSTDFGGRIDLLGMDQNGDLVIVELKRDRTPREIVAQALEYASWVRGLSFEDIDQLILEYRSKNLAVAFSECFDAPLPENINQNHSMIIVASELDDASERIVTYLAEEHSVNINIGYFTFFEKDGDEFLGRAWLKDPHKIQEEAKPRTKRPWTGYWFVNVGEGKQRNWDDYRKYGFISAGQGEWYSNALERLDKGDEFFAYMKGRGYVGYGKVVEEAQMIKDYYVKEEGKDLLDLDLKAPKAGENQDDPEKSEYVVGVEWIKTFPRDEAKTFKGVFANQNITCKLRDEATLDFLMKEFEVNV